MLGLVAICVALINGTDAGFDPGPNPLLMRHPTLSRTSIVFQFAGDLWSVAREGGDARRLTHGPGIKSQPFFSPDGSALAFSAEYDGNTDVFVMPAEGGVPKRLTAHPAPDIACGWTPDGKSVVFSSPMLSNTDFARLFTVPASGGMPHALPFPAGVEAAFSPDGTQLAYIPHGKWEQAWKRYRGGQTTPVWIGDLKESHVTSLPRKNTNDDDPMWVGDSIYYLSDPHGPVGLNRYDTKTRKATEVISGSGFDIKSASAGPGAIVYEKLGSIWLYDLAGRASHRVPISVHGDFPEVRAEFKDLQPDVHSVSPSPTGKRVAVEARGWVFTVPAAKGDARLLEGKPGVHRRDPAWSPDGKTIAYLTDEGGDQQLELYDAVGAKASRFALGESPAFYRSPIWSPDSKKIAYTDNKLNLWILEVATGKNTRIDKATSWRAAIEPRWSPDSQWLTWSRDLETLYQALFVYSLKSGKTSQITDGLAEVSSPVFDRNGKYLYFVASTNLGLAADFDDLESLTAPNVTGRIYAVLLRKGSPNPLQPESDEEGVKPVEPAKPAPFDIDLDRIERRIIPLPTSEATYTKLEPGPEGSVFALSSPPKANPISFPGPGTLELFKTSTRKLEHFADHVTSFMPTADGKEILLSDGTGYHIVGAEKPAPEGEGTVNLSGLQAKIDPRTEWAAMYHETWRNERMLFYDPGLHGIDSVALEKRYEPYLANIVSRDDLNYLFTDMLGEISIGHMFIGGGDQPQAKHIPGGLLGADFAFENGRYRLTRVYDGESWNPELTAPLARPGVDAVAGEYVLAIDGKDVTQVNDIYELLEGKAGRQVLVRLGPSPDGKGSREATVVPIASEAALRLRSWTEDNRRYVAKMTAGRAGYVHIPDTANGGWQAFNRYYYAQSDKQGMVIDERFNHGGYINDWMVREMEKPLDFGTWYRSGNNIRLPRTAVYGPKVMLINEMAGSGGDIFPFMFRQHKIGKLVGVRTWGGAWVASGFELIDGGSIRAPDDGMYNPRTGKWVIEGEGVAPDVEVDLDPFVWRQGKDSQLEAAIKLINQEMDATKPVHLERPPFPDKSKLPVR